ncbi:hypothetical protein AVEN_160502-1 [Araneus ventricosus]|uniref:Uncharacterized protein n=1 Tax=Araneus ventricosus TaxID=182803 RepID=A0A4Y2JPB1_ARAVE|nr:hypothetical protein AVEN_160502-1 [Araneus ventricosus]
MAPNVLDEYGCPNDDSNRGIVDLLANDDEWNRSHRSRSTSSSFSPIWHDSKNVHAFSDKLLEMGNQEYLKVLNGVHHVQSIAETGRAQFLLGSSYEINDP